jgi:hypothetical protein
MQSEIHPRLDLFNLKINSRKIILGSFPPWNLSLTPTLIKKSAKLSCTSSVRSIEIPFFYGSLNNRFWPWYQTNVDPNCDIADILSIKKSLARKELGVTDVILSCERKGRSALDKDLFNRQYNHNFFDYPEKGQVLKLLCTSKGVMNEMLLCKAFFNTHKTVQDNGTLSKIFENEFLGKLNGDINIINNPIFRRLEVKDGGIIECLSIPSPGSPFRKLNNFGYSEDDATLYLNSYIREAFRWFLSIHN